MAPREATTPFPDQFLSLDYEASGPIVIQPPPQQQQAPQQHDAAAHGDGTEGQTAVAVTAPALGGDVQGGGESGNTIPENSHPNQLQVHNGGNDSGGALPNDPLGNEATTGNVGNALNLAGLAHHAGISSSGGGDSSDPNSSTTSIGVRGISNSQRWQRIDPLSIDPTVDEPWESGSNGDHPFSSGFSYRTAASEASTSTFRLPTSTAPTRSRVGAASVASAVRSGENQHTGLTDVTSVSDSYRSAFQYGSDFAPTPSVGQGTYPPSHFSFPPAHPASSTVSLSSSVGAAQTATTSRILLSRSSSFLDAGATSIEGAPFHPEETDLNPTPLDAVQSSDVDASFNHFDPSQHLEQVTPSSPPATIVGSTPLAIVGNHSSEHFSTPSPVGSPISDTSSRRRPVQLAGSSGFVAPTVGASMDHGSTTAHSLRHHQMLLSVLDQAASLESDDDDDDDDDDDEDHTPDMDTTLDSANLTIPGTTQEVLFDTHFNRQVAGNNSFQGSHVRQDNSMASYGDMPLSAALAAANESGLTSRASSTAGTSVAGAVVTDEDASSTSGSDASSIVYSRSRRQTTTSTYQHLPPPPVRTNSIASSESSGSLRVIRPNHAFELSSSISEAASPTPLHDSEQQNPYHLHATAGPQNSHSFRLGSQSSSSPTPQLHSCPLSSGSSSRPGSSVSASPLTLSFGPSTSVSDLKYFAERGCIVALLAALNTPRLKTLGTRMLADYAKMTNRRVAVASNRRILEFVSRTMLEVPTADAKFEDGSEVTTELGEMGADWLGREYAVETVRSLTATEESDGYLMGCSGLLRTLALVARGGPFVSMAKNESSTSEPGSDVNTPPVTNGCKNGDSRSRSSSPNQVSVVGLASAKARLHACIAVMNLSCGKSNKVEIASVPEVLEAMRDVMMGTHFPISAAPSSSSSSSSANIAEEARLKAATCIKNLSNADANDAALLGTPGLVEALGHVAAATCSTETGASTCTTNACLALMNLSISKSNKHRVFRTPGVMDALMAVITRTSPPSPSNAEGEAAPPSNPANAEARVKACSALSNLAIGYDNKVPMFSYPGFVDAILHVIETDDGEARTKACSILWSFAAEMKNQIPVVERGDILPTLVRVAEEDGTTEARFKCVAALTLLAESLDNAVPLLHSGALAPLMDILHEAGPDPTQWKGQTASWCVGFLMNMAQSDEAVPSLREAGVVELLAPLLTLDHYQSLKAAMAVTFVCRYDEDDETYDLLRKTESVIPKIISLLHNTLSGRGGNGYKYGVFTLRSSVGCISSLASGPDFMKERIATGPVFESLLRVVTDFCVEGGTPGAIVGGGRDDTLSATLAIRALQSLTAHLIPISGSSALPFGPSMDQRLLTALDAFERCSHTDIADETRRLANDARVRIKGSENLSALMRLGVHGDMSAGSMSAALRQMGGEDAMGGMSGVSGFAASLATSCCGLPSMPGIPGMHEDEISYPLQPPATSPARSMGSQQQAPVFFGAKASLETTVSQGMEVVDTTDDSSSSSSSMDPAVRTFLLADSQSGRRFAVPIDPSGGRNFNDNRVWCYRRGRFCRSGEVPDPNFRWNDDLQRAYDTAVARHRAARSSSSSSIDNVNPSGGGTTPLSSGITGAFSGGVFMRRSSSGGSGRGGRSLGQQ